MEGREKRKIRFLHDTYTALIQNGRMNSSMWGWERTSRFTLYSKLAASCESRTDADSCYISMDSSPHLSNINKQLRLLHWNIETKESIPKSAKISVTLQATKTRQKILISYTTHPTQCHTTSMTEVSNASKYLPTYRLIWILLIESEGKQLDTDF